MRLFALLLAAILPCTALAQLPVLGKTFDEWCLLLKNGPDKRMKVVAAKVLAAKYGPDTQGVLPNLFDALVKEKDADVRLEIVSLISDMKTETRGVVDALGDALKSDPSGEVREAAARALAGRFNPLAKSYVMVLADALQDMHAGARTSAAEALRNLDKNASLAHDKLLIFVKNPKSERFARQFALQAFLNIASHHSATGGLLADIAREKETATSVRITAIEGMAKLSGGQNESVEVLAGTLQDADVEIRRASARTLAKLGDQVKPVLKQVTAAMKDSDTTVRFALIRVLANLAVQESAALTQLAEVAHKDENVENRLTAVLELENIGLGAKAVLPILEKIAEEDIRLSVREAAKKAVVKVKGE